MRRVVALVIVLSTASNARAENAGIAAARAAYDQQEQERTLAVLKPLLAGSLADRDRAAALRLLGCAHMVLGDRLAAIAAFRESFALDADAALEPQLASSPDARSLFEVARGEWRAALVIEMEKHAAEIKALHLAVHAPARGRGGRPIAIDVAVTDPGHLVSRIELAYRRRGQGAFTLLTERLTAPSAAPLAFSIPSDATESVNPFVVEYHVTLRHQTGFDLRRDGDPDHPRSLAVDAGHRPQWHESWWVRGAFALGVVGLGAGGYFLYRSIDVGPQHVVVGGPS